MFKKSYKNRIKLVQYLTLIFKILKRIKMSEIINNRKVHSLWEYISSISRAVEKYYGKEYWVKAEISKLNFFAKSGHCYPELIENQNGQQIANASGFIHRNDYQRINKKLLETTGEPLKDGMVVLIYCKVHLSTTRGLKIDISDIDINSIVGEQTQLKILTINRLKSDGVFALNKQKTLSRIIKHLAVISVETGKGYADFISIINNAQKISVKTTLFNSMMMGETAVTEIQSSLHAISARQKEFDAVCIIRGGGGDATLQCFNNYELAKSVATFPLPVLSGIGHATNDTITEQVSLISFVSPSELANYIIDYDIAEVERFQKLTKKISDRLVFHKNNYVNNFKFPVENFKLKFKFAFGRKFNEIEAKKARIMSLVHKNLAAKNQQLATTIANVMSAVRVPAAQNKITVEGKNVQGAKDLKRDDEISIFFNDGIVFAQVINVIKKGL
jgi:exodeoxyribonuclease VII large subunit